MEETMHAPRLSLNIVAYVGFGPRSTDIVRAARTLASLLTTSPIRAEVTVVRLPFVDEELEQFDLPTVKIELSSRESGIMLTRAHGETAHLPLWIYGSPPPVVEA